MYTDAGSGSAVESRHESLLNETESSEASIGPILRSVYEDGSQKQFLDKLDLRIKMHDKEIERMCNFHYQGFVEAVNELIKVRSDARNLKIHVKKANTDLQSSGAELQKKLEELAKHRVVQRNIAATIETLSLCIPVLEMYAKLSEQKASKRYYPALKTLEQLEHTHLSRIKKFTEIMRNKLPSFREGIKTAAMDDLMLFLENVRAQSEKLGEIAMKQAHHQYSLTLLHGVDIGLDEHDGETELCPEDLVDFSPVYRCYHIFSALGEKDFFVQHYRKQRKQQSRLAFDWQRASASIHESLDSFQGYFHQIVGFFIVEDTIMNTTQGLVTRGTVDELWDTAVQKIGTVLSKQCAQLQTLALEGCQSNLEDSSLMLKIKELIVWFSHTLGGLGFSITALYNVLLQMRDQYNEMLARSWSPIFDQIGHDDNYSPLTVMSEEDMTRDVRHFPFKEEREGFPKCYPFSAFVPKVFQEIKNFIRGSLKFNENLNISRTEIDQSVRKATNMLLAKILSGSLKSLILSSNLTLAQLARISVNTNHLEEACPELEKFISSVTGTSDEGVNITRLYGSSTFKDIRGEAEQQIFEKLNSKMDEFFGLASYNWTPSSQRSQPSGYLMDLIAYLQGAFITFEELPGNVAKTACMSSCKHLANTLRGYLLDDEVKQINKYGLSAFDVDLKNCEEFAASQPVAGFEEGTLEMTFVELRQIVDLLVSGDWANYCAEYKERGSSNRKYARVQPQIAAKLLEKFTESKKGINFKKADRDKKKMTESILKRLKTLDQE